MTKTTTNRFRRTLLPALLALLTLALGACTVYLDPDNVRVRSRVSLSLSLSDVLLAFEPARGEGAVYAPNEDIAFEVFSRRDGYLTLTAIDPDGSVYTFARNIFVEGGRTNLITGTSPRNRFVVTGPPGQHFVRAAFTPVRTDPSRVTYTNVRGRDDWNNRLTVELRSYEVRDVVETTFFVR